MEISSQYKNLYKHWIFHTDNTTKSNFIKLNEFVLHNIVDFINERISIFEKKEKGLTPPYTNDPILQNYRFCNIFREFDKQTVFYHSYLKPIESNFELWLLNMLFCRSICNIDTVKVVGLLNFDIKNNLEIYQRLLRLKSPKYGTAYIFPISTIQKSKWNTREKLFCLYYPTIIRKVAGILRNLNKSSVIDALSVIVPAFQFNLKFLWTEVLIDISYQFPQYIDLYKIFPIGPGSEPTMKMLCSKYDPVDVNLNLVGLLDNQIKLPTFNGNTLVLSAENWEGIGCEFRKYSNLKEGKGRKRIYKTSTL